MAELADLYQDLIIDHSRQPRNRRSLPAPPARSAEGHNPLCGDRVRVFVEMDDGAIRLATFDGVGCAICTASASLMTDAVTGKTIDNVRAMFKRFHSLVRGEGDALDHAAALGKLAAFAGVSEYPVRVKCATLPWHTLIAALDNENETVSTE